MDYETINLYMVLVFPVCVGVCVYKLIECAPICKHSLFDCQDRVNVKEQSVHNTYRL